MARQGNLLIPSNISIDDFSGDASTTVFILVNGTDLATDNGYQIYVDGVLQHIGTDVTRIGLQLTFSIAPPSGTNNIRIYTLAERLDSNTPSDGSVDTVQLSDFAATTNKLSDNSVTADKLTAGAFVQSNFVRYTTETTSTSTIPLDDTIPQISEGLEIFSLPFTKKLQASYLLIDGVINISNQYEQDVDEAIILALFEDANVNAIATTAWGYDIRTLGAPTSHQLLPRYFNFIIETSAIIEVDYNLRVGSRGQTFTLNGFEGTTRFNNTLQSHMRITEIKT